MKLRGRDLFGDTKLNGRCDFMTKKKIKQFIVALAVILLLLNVSEAGERQTEVTFKINL